RRNRHAAAKRGWNVTAIASTREWERIHREHAAERPGRSGDAKDETEHHVPALLPPIRDARRARRRAIALRRRIHPDADREADNRGSSPETGRPDDDATPGELVLAERREIQPVRNRSKVGTKARGPGGVLHDLSRDLRDVDLFPAGPRVLPERFQTAKRSLHRPLIDIDRLDRRRGGWLTGPRRRH